MSISSRPDLSTSLKVSGNRTNYKPVEMTDESVFDLARHYYTLDEIAARFGVSNHTVLEHHGDAFREGKHNAMQKPRMLLNKIFDDFMGSDGDTVNFARPDVPVHNLLKAIELHAKKYEGMGSKQTIEHKGLNYDSVESQVEVIERPVEESDED